MMPPEYQAAHAKYASDKAIERAFEAGHDIFASNVTANQHQAMLNNLSEPEQNAYKAGAAKAVYDLSGTQAKTAEAGAMRKFANQSGFARQKFGQTFGQDQAQGVFDAIESLEKMKETNNLILGGSKTAKTLAPSGNIPGLGPASPERTAEKLIGYETGGDIGERVGSFIPGFEFAGKQAGRAIGTSIGAMAGPFQEAAEAVSSRAREELAKALTSAPTPEIIRALKVRPGYAGVGPMLSRGAQIVSRAVAPAYATTLPSAILPAPVQ
jgi:hypothetical protein